MDTAATGYTAEQIDALLASGGLERIGMGSRRTCYRLPRVKLCVKCYRSDEEIAEGQNPQWKTNGPLSASVVREIHSCRFDERRNTCCQEFEYWKELKRELPKELAEVFPSTMEKMLLPSRGWCVVEELMANADGSPPRGFSWEFWHAAPPFRAALAASQESLVDELARFAVRMYDPQNLLVQKNADGTFRIRIADFEPASRTFIALDRFPFIVRMKLRRRFSRYRKMFDKMIRQQQNERK